MRGYIKRVAAVAVQLCVLIFLAVAHLPAQTGRGFHDLRFQEVRGEDLEVKIAVFGPGDELYFWWGHMALIIDNKRTGYSRSYDWGIFSFNVDQFFANFAMGRLWYESGSSSAQNVISNYMRSNRDITVFTLDLSPERREEIYRLAEESTLYENRYYLYHHFYDNCVTRILNIIDQITDGQFTEHFKNEPGRFTLRQHVRRHTWRSPFFNWILNFWMGQKIDVPISVWDEMFLPSEVARHIVDFSYIDTEGVSRNLVSDVEEVYRSYGRPAVLEVPRKQWPRELTFSLFLSLFLGFLFYVQKKSPAAGQVLLGICHTVLGFVFGTAGLVLLFMSLFTEHDYTFNNINLFFCNPLLLAAVPLGLRYASADNYNKRLFAETSLRLIWLFTVLGVFVSMLVKLSPRFWQDNLPDQMLILPVALILSLEPASLRRLIKRIFWRWS